MTANARLAGAVLTHLSGLGVKEVMVCAGARNVPLVASLLATCQEKGLNVRHHFDERAAAFFALGLAKKRCEPVAILTTSGTAAAELLPASIEGFYSGIPLVLVTADRPASFRGSGAPQAIEQAGLFGSHVEMAFDVASPDDLHAISEWRGKGPLHLNVSFEEPTSGDGCVDWESGAPREIPVLPADGAVLSAFCREAKRLVVLLGELREDWQDEVEQFLVKLGVPVWAEATSGLRESVALSKVLIRSESAIAKLNPDRVLRLGGVPSLRFWRDLEKIAELPVLSVGPSPFPGLARPSQIVVTDGLPEVVDPSEQGWVDDQTLLGGADLEQTLTEHPFSEPGMMRALSLEIPEKALVFLGNSLPIREWNLAAEFSKPHPRCFASRGANGIDGQIATFLGLSIGEDESWGIFGDLTALYDLNAPALLDQLGPGKRRIVVLNNGGGRIFSRLPSMSGLKEEEKQVTENRHSIRFEAWAAMWGLAYCSWRGGDPFPTIPDSDVVVEVMIDDKATEAFWEARR